MATPIVAPTTIPGPSAGDLSPAERRLLSDLDGGPQQVRVIQRDYLAVQKLEWLFTASQAATFYEWWRDTLIYGGAWFSAAWPMPTGWTVTSVRRFIGTPQWSAIPGGSWRVTAVNEIRGLSLLPQDTNISHVTTPSIGWGNPVDDPYGYTFTAAHDNSGTVTWFASNGLFAAAYMAFTYGDVVVWNIDWHPVAYYDTSPYIYDQFSGVVVLRLDSIPANNYGPPQGYLILTATINGVTSDSLLLSTGFGAYSDVAWMPNNYY